LTDSGFRFILGYRFRVSFHFTDRNEEEQPSQRKKAHGEEEEEEEDAAVSTS
jgi:hypothetical protein